jgi:predicted ester cyclase
MKRKLFEEYAQSHDPKYFAPDSAFTVVPLASTLKGRDAIGGMLRMFYHDAFSDARADLGHVAFDEEKDVGSIEFVFRGKHTGDLMGLKPTNRQVEVPMLAVYEGKNNELVNARLYYDNLSFMRQLGQAP